MNGNNQSRRGRVRAPYDLRRKVLLKNFLREQMSDAPVESSTGPSVDRENLVPDVVEATSEAMGVDIENEPIDVISVSAESLTQETESDSEEIRGIQHHKKSPWKSTLTIDFSKITELKLSRLTRTKRKSSPLSESDLKTIKKTEDKSEFNNKKACTKSNDLKMEAKEMSLKIAEEILAQLPDETVSELAIELSAQLKNKLAIKQQNKNGIIKAKHSLKNSKPLNDKVQRRSFKDFKTKIKKCLILLQNKITKNKPSNEDTKTDELIQNLIKKQENEIIELNSEEEECQLCKNNATEIDNASVGSSILNVENIDISMNSHKKSILNSASTQCATSELEWSLHEIRKLETANRRLIEENKLLSESLSSIMADADGAFKSYNNFKRSCTNYNRSYNNKIPLIFHSHYCKNPSNYNRSFSSSFGMKSDKIKVLRTKSMQEQAERRREIRMHLSSKSMCHRPYSRIPPKTLYRAQPCIITPYLSPTKEYSKKASELPSIFPSHLYCSSGKMLNRRSSMPERNTRKHVVSRRSSCVQDSPYSRTRQNLLSLPREAFY